MADDLKIFTDGTDTYVARSEHEAMLLRAHDTGHSPDESEPFHEVMGPTLRIWDEDTNKSEEKTLVEWIADLGGPGLLCSTEI